MVIVYIKLKSFFYWIDPFNYVKAYAHVLDDFLMIKIAYGWIMNRKLPLFLMDFNMYRIDYVRSSSYMWVSIVSTKKCEQCFPLLKVVESYIDECI